MSRIPIPSSHSSPVAPPSPSAFPALVSPTTSIPQPTSSSSSIPSYAKATKSSLASTPTPSPLPPPQPQPQHQQTFPRQPRQSHPNSATLGGGPRSPYARPPPDSQKSHSHSRSNTGKLSRRSSSAGSAGSTGSGNGSGGKGKEEELFKVSEEKKKGLLVSASPTSSKFNPLAASFAPPSFLKPTSTLTAAPALVPTPLHTSSTPSTSNSDRPLSPTLSALAPSFAPSSPILLSESTSTSQTQPLVVTPPQPSSPPVEKLPEAELTSKVDEERPITPSFKEMKLEAEDENKEEGELLEEKEPEDLAMGTPGTEEKVDEDLVKELPTPSEPTLDEKTIPLPTSAPQPESTSTSSPPALEEPVVEEQVKEEESKEEESKPELLEKEEESKPEPEPESEVKEEIIEEPIKEEVKSEPSPELIEEPTTTPIETSSSTSTVPTPRSPPQPELEPEVEAPLPSNEESLLSPVLEEEPSTPSSLEPEPKLVDEEATPSPEVESKSIDETPSTPPSPSQHNTSSQPLPIPSPSLPTTTTNDNESTEVNEVDERTPLLSTSSSTRGQEGQGQQEDGSLPITKEPTSPPPPPPPPTTTTTIQPLEMPTTLEEVLAQPSSQDVLDVDEIPSAGIEEEEVLKEEQEKMEEGEKETVDSAFAGTVEEAAVAVSGSEFGKEGVEEEEKERVVESSSQRFEESLVFNSEEKGGESLPLGKEEEGQQVIDSALAKDVDSAATTISPPSALDVSSHPDINPTSLPLSSLPSSPNFPPVESSTPFTDSILTSFLQNGLITETPKSHFSSPPKTPTEVPTAHAEEPPSLTLALVAAWKKTVWLQRVPAIFLSAVINLGLPFLNGVALGVGELVARNWLSIKMGWSSPASARGERANTSSVGLGAAGSRRRE